MHAVISWSTFYEHFIGLLEHNFWYCICQINHSLASNLSSCQLANLHLDVLYSQIHRNYQAHKLYLASESKVRVFFHCMCSRPNVSIADIVQKPQC